MIDLECIMDQVLKAMVKENQFLVQIGVPGKAICVIF